MKIRVPTIFALILWAPPAVAAEPWETESRLAHVLVDNKPDEALRRYDEAIRLLQAKSGGSTSTIIIDLQLNKADALANNQRLKQAEDLLRAVEPQVMASHNPSLEIRYQRRLTKLRRAQHDYSESCRIQARNLELIASACGRDTLAYAEELQRLMETAMDGMLWSPFIKAANDMKSLNDSCLKPKDKQRTGEWLRLDFERSNELANSEIQKGNLTGIDRYLTEFSKYSTRAYFSIILWKSLFQKASAQGQDTLAQHCVNELNKLSADRRISAQQADQIALALLMSVLDDVYKIDVRQSTESRLQSASAILERARKSSELSNAIIYIQCKSLYALTLTRRHKAQAAERVLDQVSPGPELLRSCDSVTGIVQARIALGQEFHRTGDDVSAHRQFDSLDKLMDRVSESKERQRQLKDLHEQKALTFR